MSILQTFYIQWVGDASKAIKEDEKINKSIDKTENKIKNLGDSTSKVGQQFSQLAQSFSAAVTAAVGVGAILGGLKGAAEYATQLGFVSKQLGVNTEDLDAWGQAVQNAGGSVEGFQSSLKGLAQHLGGSATVALKVLPLLADTFQKLGKTRANQYGKMLGLDESTILLLQQGRREVEAVINKQKELGLVSQKDAETFVKFKTELNDTSHAFRTLFTSLAISAIPVLEDFLHGFTAVAGSLTKHKDFVIGAFYGIAGAAAVMAAPFIAANGAVVLLAGGLALLAAAFEDLKAFKEGKNSLIGDLTKKYGIKIESNAELEARAQENYANFKRGQGILNDASNTPLNSSVVNSSLFNRNQEVNLGPITINTQANSAQGIAKSLGKNVQELWQVNNYFADGVYA